MHTLYSKILFAGIGLLFAISVFGQDSSKVEGGDCETFKKMQKDNIYKDKKIFSGYYIKCDKNNKVTNMQLFENGKFISYVELPEVDSVLNAQLKYILNCNQGHGYPCNPQFENKTKNCPQFTEDGIYKNGLFTGKKYVYDKNGLLDRIEIYKNGKYVGDAEID